MPGGSASNARAPSSVTRGGGRTADGQLLEVVDEGDPPDDQRVGSNDEHDRHLAAPDVDPLEAHRLVGVGDRVQGGELGLLFVTGLPERLRRRDRRVLRQVGRPGTRQQDRARVDRDDDDDGEEEQPQEQDLADEPRLLPG